MLSLPQRKTESGREQGAAWHPDFRNPEKLPDIKTVRTSFFVNSAAFVALACAGGFVGYYEYTLSSARYQLTELQASIDRDAKVSGEAGKVFKSFQENEKKLLEVDAFLRSRPLVSPLLVHLGQTLPEDMALSYFEVVGSELLLHGVVSGSPELASAEASAYLEGLKNDSELKAQFESFSLVGLEPDARTGMLKMILRLRFKAPKTEGKP